MNAAASLRTDLIFLVLQYLYEFDLKESAHQLEKDSRVFMDLRYVEELCIKGEWTEAENYLSAFTSIQDNNYSRKMFFEIRKQKYLEALDRKDTDKAVEILMNDLKVFEVCDKAVIKDLTQLLTMDDIRSHEKLSTYKDTQTVRPIIFNALKSLILRNEAFTGKLDFPIQNGGRLRQILQQSFHYQHQLHCNNPQPNPEFKSFLVDHVCEQASSSSNQIAPIMLMGIPLSSPPMVAQQTPPSASAAMFGGSGNNTSAMPRPPFPSIPVSMAPPNSAGTSTNNMVIDNRGAESQKIMRRSIPSSVPNEFNNVQANISPFKNPGHVHSQVRIPDQFPRSVVATLNPDIGSTTSMDFHPMLHNILLVGTSTGSVALWDISKRKKIASRNFKTWDVRRCLKVSDSTRALANKFSISINRVLWSPDGVIFGIAYSQHLLHVYYYHGDSDVRNHLEIHAHVGSVNDIAFCRPFKRISIVTCGDDNTVKVWDARSGLCNANMIYEHEAPVFSLCPYSNKDAEYIFSVSTDAKIKAWKYGEHGSQVNYVAPGNCCTRMAYNADCSRLFSCGTTKEGNTYLVEWNDCNGTVKRSYEGLQISSSGMVHFDMFLDRYIAAGNESVIKIWNIDYPCVLTTIEKDGLAATPYLRFSRKGFFLAVTSNTGGVHILATAEGVQMLNVADTNRSSPSICENEEQRGPMDIESEVADETSSFWTMPGITEPSECRSLRLIDSLLTRNWQVSKVAYSHSGGSIVASASNGVHSLWKWQKTDKNIMGNATTIEHPEIYIPKKGEVMINELNNEKADLNHGITELRHGKTETRVWCSVFSNNDSYLASTSGGSISIYNIVTFQNVVPINSEPPHPIVLAFLPKDNNIIALGMEDALIHIYNCRNDTVDFKLYGHEKAVTGLAFSSVLNVLVSSGADAQLCVWSIDEWKKIDSKLLHIPPDRISPLAGIYVEFHPDQKHFMAIHETQLAIYNTIELQCVMQWVPGNSSNRITHATHSCDGLSIYASFGDGTVGVFNTAGLAPRAWMSPKAYVLPHISTSIPGLYPNAVAAHPSEPNQFALGMTDGGVYILEPLEPEGQWGTGPPVEVNGSQSDVSDMANSADHQASADHQSSADHQPSVDHQE